MTEICYCDMGEHQAKPNGSNGVLHIPSSPKSSTSSLTASLETQSQPIIPKNFVWGLQGGRRASSSTTSTEPDQADAMAAVEVVAKGPIDGILRDSFDPWTRHNTRRQKGGGKENVYGRDGDDDEVCKGCIKISRARASKTFRSGRRAGSHG
ncbi:hypothetical protein QR685DRAFT_294503 [Neurospora intermedia]|uniref:Uncharacterized protein n=1 Tax=Neurospora intermedia TaxID=5142 RepID=A0ABR3DA83_NEUIN